ncbi:MULTISPECIES: SprT-like family protein [Nostocales]|uniref:SprT family zinc-dependent metalloprotease n=2 Tax=Nostocales TaxID=1161 RepID=A0A0C1R4M7_9CYAN|nr:SprT-like family protein [Tolypothrix bouteillei]KAF3886751.1 SprT family zinc-dependent metalloprotease [Tolypothrix bouteillei VB521301]
MTIGLKNIKAQQHTVVQKIFDLASSPTPNAAQMQELLQTLMKIVTTIEKICSDRQTTPANLTSSSRQIYSWMKFLTDERNLQLHVQATHRLQHIAQQTYSARGRDSIKVIVEITNLAGLYRSKIGEYFATLIVSEGFINAPDEVLQVLVQAALFGNSRNTTRAMKDFASSEEYSDILMELDLIVEAIAETPTGTHYNLDKLFDKINEEYFAAKLVKPRLTWSKIHTYRKFAHYEPARDRVVMSITLDDDRIPEFVVEFVLYHELLHKYHGTKLVNGRRMVHTSEFRTSERKFRLYQEAEEWLKKIASIAT